MRIMEIGTANGNHAFRLIKAISLVYPPEKIEYYGFDLFEPTSKYRGTKYESPPMQNVREKLMATRAVIRLWKGDTNHTAKNLELPPMNFIYIDGGHDARTVENDWEFARQCMDERTIVVFGDNHLPDVKKVTSTIDRAVFPNVYFEDTVETKKQSSVRWALLSSVANRLREMGVEI